MRKRMTQIVRYTFLTLLGLSVLAIISINTAPVQKLILNKVISDINKAFDTDISFAEIYVSPWLEIDLKGVKALDQKRDTLLYIGELKTTLSQLNLALGRYRFRDIQIDNPIVINRLYPGDSSSTLHSFLEKWMTKKGGKPQLPISISGNLSIQSGRFQQLDYHEKEPLQYDFKNISLKASKVAYRGDGIGVTIDSASLRETLSGFAVKKLSLQGRLGRKSGVVNHFELATNHSAIHIPSLRFSSKNKDWTDFESLYQSVFWKARIAETTLSLRDLSTFIPDWDRGDSLRISAQLEGSLSNLKIKNLRVDAARQTAVSADLTLRLNRKDYMIRGHFKQLQTDYQDLVKMLPRSKGRHIPLAVAHSGLLNYVGTAEIASDYRALNGTLHTDIGTLSIQGAFTHYSTASKAQYTGLFQSERFNIGRLIGNPYFGDVAIDATLNGTGLDPAYFKGEIKGKINYLEAGNYRYQNITAKGWIKDKAFNGKIHVDDPNAKLIIKGKMDMATENRRFSLDAIVEKINMGKLKWYKTDSLASCSGKISVDVEGTSIDNAVGIIRFSNMRYVNSHDYYYFKDFDISSKIDSNGLRRMQVDSPDILSGEIKGKFKLTQLLPLTKNALGRLFANYRPIKLDKGQYFSYHFNVHNSAINAFAPRVKLQANTQLSGIVNAEKNRFKLNFNSPGIQYKDAVALDLHIHIDTQSDKNNEIKFSKARIQGIKIYRFVTQVHFETDTLFLQSKLNLLEAEKNAFHIDWYQTINADNQFIIGFLPSNLNYRNKDWILNPQKADDVKLVIDARADWIHIPHFVIQSGGSKLTGSARIQGKHIQNIKIRVDKVKLSEITPEWRHIRLAGIASGTLTIQNVSGRPDPRFDLHIADFTCNGISYGNVRAAVRRAGTTPDYEVSMVIRDPRSQRLNLKTRVFQNSDNRFEVSGHLRLNDFDIRFLNGFLTNVLELKGEVNGDIALSGLLEDPITEGAAYARDLEAYVPYTNVKYKFPPQISIALSHGKLIIPPTRFYDVKFEQNGTIQGELHHRQFSKWDIKVRIQTDGLLVLHTDETQNPDYFGTVFATGSVDVNGPTHNLNIEASATTDKNSTLNIPLGGFRMVDKANFITFLPPKKVRKASVFFEERLQKKEKHEKPGNVNFHVNLKATEDVKVQITFGGENANYLIGRGNGDLEMKTNSYGDFNLYGTYRVNEGNYIFNFNDIISKRFTVEKGGTISWNGNPYEAILNLNTRYDTKVSNLGEYLGAYLKDTKSSGNIDVALLAHLSGHLSNPHFDFGVTTPRAGRGIQTTSAGQAIQTALRDRMQSKGEKIKQFGSILATQRFSTSLFNPGIELSGSAIEALFNQLGHIFSTISDKVHFDLKYAQGDRISSIADEFNVDLTAQLNDRITVVSNLGIPIGQRKISRFSGEVEVLYDLNPKKTLQFKAFNQRDEMEGLSTRISGYKQGLGIQYTRDFHTFKDLKEKIFGKRIKPHTAIPKTKADSTSSRWIEFKSTSGG